jgi:predicted dehydrogenase
VLLEKPLAIDVRAGWDLVEAAKQAGVLLATG